MEEKLKQFKEYLINAREDEYNLLEEIIVYNEILSKFEEIFNL